MVRTHALPREVHNSAILDQKCQVADEVLESVGGGQGKSAVATSLVPTALGMKTDV